MYCIDAHYQLQIPSKKLLFLRRRLRYQQLPLPPLRFFLLNIRAALPPDDYANEDPHEQESNRRVLSLCENVLHVIFQSIHKFGPECNFPRYYLQGEGTGVFVDPYEGA